MAPGIAVEAVAEALASIADVHIDDDNSAHIANYSPEADDLGATAPGTPWDTECRRLLAEIRAALPSGWTASWSDDDVVITRTEVA